MDAGGVSLIVASLDLKLVKLLRGAMAAADGQACGPFGTTILHPEDRFEPRKVLHPEPRFEPRKVLHPTPRYEPRPVLHPTPRWEPSPDCPPCNSCEPKAPTPPHCLPPWAQPLPAPKPIEPARTIKVVFKQPDIVHKGSLIDTFI